MSFDVIQALGCRVAIAVPGADGPFAEPYFPASPLICHYREGFGWPGLLKLGGEAVAEFFEIDAAANRHRMMLLERIAGENPELDDRPDRPTRVVFGAPIDHERAVSDTSALHAEWAAGVIEAAIDAAVRQWENHELCLNHMHRACAWPSWLLAGTVEAILRHAESCPDSPLERVYLHHGARKPEVLAAAEAVRLSRLHRAPRRVSRAGEAQASASLAKACAPYKVVGALQVSFS